MRAITDEAPFAQRARGRHGGVRPGAGRPPKALRYAQQVAAQEAKLVAAMPEMIDLLLAAARKGDTSAARYVVDRVLGRVQTQAKPVAEDYTLPFDHPGAGETAAIRRQQEAAKALTCSDGMGEAVATNAATLAAVERYSENGLTLEEGRSEDERQFEAAKVPDGSGECAAAKAPPPVAGAPSRSPRGHPVACAA